LAARAIWKGIIKIGGSKLPVKLYSAVKDSSIHFRLLHDKDKQPVKQQMINPSTDEVVEYSQIKMAYPITRSQYVILEDEELEKIEPKESRDIEITRFVNPSDIDHRFYQRAYYLGPDGSTPDYFALAAALEKKEREGIAKWVMRGKSYVGSLRADDGYLMLITLRHAEEVIEAESLRPPQSRALDKKEISMAEQLVDALAGEFDAEEFRDDYRDRVMELIELKSKGKKPKVTKFRPRVVKDDSLDKALAASLAATGKRRAAGGSRG
jgi:DNA end-binding protein Ku